VPRDVPEAPQAVRPEFDVARVMPNGDAVFAGRAAPGAEVTVLDGDEAVGSLVEASLMQRALEQPTLLDRPVREVMEPPLPEVEAGMLVDRLAPLLTKESPAVLVRDGRKLVGIVSRYDLLQEMIGR